MTDPKPNAAELEELYDRLIDAGLRETVGGQSPPDLTDRILAAAQADDRVALGSGALEADATVGNSGRRFRWLWAGVALAASLLIAIGLVVPNVRQGMRRAVVLRDGSRPVEEKVKHEVEEFALRYGIDSYDSQLEAENTAKANPVPNPNGRIMLAKEPALIRKPSDGLAIAPSVPPAPSVDLAADFPEGMDGTTEAGAQRGLIENRLAEAGVGGRTNLARRRDRFREVFGRGGKLVVGRPVENSRSESDLKLQQLAEGVGAGQGGDRYARIVENEFKAVSPATTDNRLSTFSIDVDTASYANVRQFLSSGALPPADAVRIEELVNYFDYDYSAPAGDVPFAANVEVAACPWNGEHRLARIGIKGREMDRTKRPKSNLVFLIDVSGSMDEPAKLPLLVEGMRMLTRELGENDRVAIVVYASTEGLALASTPGTERDQILDVLDRLAAGGSTAGGAGIELAYKIARENFIKGGVNRVILCTDGDFNVGVTSTAELERLAEAKAKDTGVFLTVLGFGRGNLNDEMMEKIADKGNGNYHYVDTQSEARKVLVEEMAGTLVTIAKDVKIQIEFNPAQVAGYRLIGYENRVLAAEDFNDDKKDAGEIGAGHTVTALYEIVPAGKRVDVGNVDDLKYQAPAAAAEGEDEPAAGSDELFTLKIRYKEPDGHKSTKLEFPVTDGGQSFGQASDDFKFASAVASFGMLLRDSAFKGNATYAAIEEIAKSASGRDPHGYRKEFVGLVEQAKQLAAE